MRATLRFLREIKNLLRDSENVSIHFLFSTIDEQFVFESNETSPVQLEGSNSLHHNTRNNRKEMETEIKLPDDDTISAYILMRTLPNSLYDQNIYCLKFSITQKYPIEAPDVLFVKGKEIIKAIERIVGNKTLQNMNDEFISEKGIHCPNIIQNEKSGDLNCHSQENLSKKRSKKNYTQNLQNSKSDMPAQCSDIERKLFKLLDRNDLNKFLHCREPIRQRTQKKTLFGSLKQFFVGDKQTKNTQETSSLGEERIEHNSSELQIGNSQQNDKLKQFIRSQDNMESFCGQKVSEGEKDQFHKDKKNCANKRLSQNVQGDVYNHYETSNDDIDCCEITMSQVLNFLNQIKIPIHPHIYSNGHICSSLMRDWAPVHNMTVISMSYLVALNTNDKEEGPENDGIYSFFNRKGSRNTKWLYEGEM